MVGPTVMTGMASFGRLRHQHKATPPPTTEQQANKERPEIAAIATCTGLRMLEQLLL